MEIKAILQKPYTDGERTEFIIQQNHNLGYEIRETEEELQAWGYTEEEKQEQEKERIGNLTCTKRVLVLMLEQMGFDYFEQIEPLINANRAAKLEWTLCTELLRSNPLLDVFAQKLDITSAQMDELFIRANNM